MTDKIAGTAPATTFAADFRCDHKLFARAAGQPTPLVHSSRRPYLTTQYGARPGDHGAVRPHDAAGGAADRRSGGWRGRHQSDGMAFTCLSSLRRRPSRHLSSSPILSPPVTSSPFPPLLLPSPSRQLPPSLPLPTPPLPPPPPLSSSSPPPFPPPPIPPTLSATRTSDTPPCCPSVTIALAPRRTDAP